MKFFNFFLFLWVILALLDPDPLTRLNPDPIRIRNPGFFSGYGPDPHYFGSPETRPNEAWPFFDCF
jgi:hypothetical protein